MITSTFLFSDVPTFDTEVDGGGNTVLADAMADVEGNMSLSVALDGDAGVSSPGAKVQPVVGFSGDGLGFLVNEPGHIRAVAYKYLPPITGPTQFDFYIVREAQEVDDFSGRILFQLATGAGGSDTMPWVSAGTGISIQLNPDGTIYYAHVLGNVDAIFNTVGVVPLGVWTRIRAAYEPGVGLSVRIGDGAPETLAWVDAVPVRTFTMLWFNEDAGHGYDDYFGAPRRPAKADSLIVTWTEAVETFIPTAEHPLSGPLAARRTFKGIGLS